MQDQEIANAIAAHQTYANLEGQHRLFTELRHNDPVHWTEPEGHRPFWTVTKHADIMEIERQPEKFLNSKRNKLFSIDYEQKMAAAAGGKHHFGRAISVMDADDHKIYRGIAQEWFMPSPIRGLSPQITELAHRSLRLLVERAPALDFYKEIAAVFPLRVIMLILGIDAKPETEKELQEITATYFGGTDPEISGDGAGVIEASFRYFDFFEPLVAEKRENPKQDVATLIANAEVAGKPIDHGIAQMYFVSLAGAGHDTTGSTLAGGILELIRNPGEWDKLKANPDLVNSAVEEMIRWVSPVKHFLRTAAEDYELRGRTIKAGEHVFLSYPSANRDEDIFEDPWSFRIDRRPNKHVGFGFGPHVCLGLALARLELQIFMREMLPLVKRFELDGEPKWTWTNFVGGLKTLPVKYELE
ncbi:MAG: cytochrome P450 [Flavobacteriaceae bacterium]